MVIPVSFEQVTANSVDGAQMGKGVLEKNAFFGSTPVIQPTSGDQAAVSATAAAAALTSAQLNFTWTANDPGVTNGAATMDDGNTVGDDNDAGGAISAIEDQYNKLQVDVAAQKVELDKLITDVASLITLGNQVRSELVTLGLIKGS